MEKQKRWQFYLILAVILLTLYNVMPTIFYYTKPLKSPIDESKASSISEGIVSRVNSLEKDSQEWLRAFCKLLGLKPQSIALKENDPRLFELTFNDPSQATTFKRFLSRAGLLIPFAPAQLETYPEISLQDPNKVYVARQIGVRLDPNMIKELFHYVPKYEAKGKISDRYRAIIYDRVEQIALALAGPSKTASQLIAVAQNPNDTRYDELIINLARDINEVEKTLGNSPLAKRYYASFTQTDAPARENLIEKFIVKMEGVKSKIQSQREPLLEAQKKGKEQNISLDPDQRQLLSILDNQYQTLETANATVRKYSSEFKAGQKPLSLTMIRKNLENGSSDEQHQTLNLEERNPFFHQLLIDWTNDKIVIQPSHDVQAILFKEGPTETENLLQERLNQFVINDIARVSQIADETILPEIYAFSINLNKLTNTQSYLTFELGQLATKQTQQLRDQLLESWTPKHKDLTRQVFPVYSYDAYKKLKPEEQKLGLVVYAPSMEKEAPPTGFKAGSIYVIARGLDSIIQKYRQNPEASENQTLENDIQQLINILQLNGFIGYSGASYGMASEFNKDYIFELDDYFNNMLKATREDFTVKGSKRHAVLDLTDVEQRILALNKIDDRIQEDLLKWQEEYNAAQVDINATSKYLIPSPTKNPYWENFKLSFIKYFRGDDRKILKWGLDLSGGKTVRIGLRDHNNREVTNPDDLKQALNELYNRINKMGVAERTIRLEGDNIILDFPGSQGISAQELVKASAMYFHIVNEKFTPNNTALKETVQQFLQNVWNEAVVTNRKDIESINEIAWQHLGGETLDEGETRPRSAEAELLYENGLRLANPKTTEINSTFNDTISSIAMMPGNEFTEWDGQSHPLLIVFHNFALEGSSLSNIQVGYDPTEGNILTFNIKSSYDNHSGSPRDDFYAWTSQFAEDKIAGTPKDAYSQGKGWRMAVILNGSIISKPVLRAALRDGATISGRFSQREVNQLAADLKAGSLSFTPRILSEQNVSPELGREERNRGVIASLVALAAVVIAMVGYYHFAGVVASCAVLFNILIMWGVMQNIGAVLTLPGIAGIVLTIGMAVDANVLVFERIREEFSISGRLGAAIQAGYRKAFSAIIDSNITTIIAALILIQFDSGPVKGFAVTLIIGIISSMFTALFMTRYFFAWWVQNPKHKSLNMSKFIDKTQFDFLGKAKIAISISLVIMILGGYLFLSQAKTIFGMDFTGGYSLSVDLQEKPANPSYRLEATDALLAHGATSNDFQIRELSKSNQLRIQLGMGMEEKGHPFYQLPEAYKEGRFAYEWEQNPRIVWLVNALSDANLKIQPSQLTTLDRQWTVMSGQFSDAMRNNAIIGLLIALISILVYITFRFEFKFAIGAVVGLIHDVIITLGILALFHQLGFSVQIDLQVVGAIMTIIGYSLNDTIIVFDRIREDIKILRKMKFYDIVNHALNVTLSRTIMTSGTTLLVLLALVLLGGKSIFAFSLVMTIGVIVGTLSSLFIASPVMLYFHQRELQQAEEEVKFKRA